VYLQGKSKLLSGCPTIIYNRTPYFTKNNLHVATGIYSIRDGKSLAIILHLAAYETSAGTSDCRVCPHLSLAAI
jgi:hypothetical protein